MAVKTRSGLRRLQTLCSPDGSLAGPADRSARRMARRSHSGMVISPNWLTGG